MFIRVKHNGNYDYLQLVSSERIDGKVRQSVIGTLGRRDLLESTDTLAGLMASLGKFTRHAAVLADHRSGRTEMLWTHSLGPALVFGRLWEQLSLPAVLAEALEDRKFGFAVERAIFLTVLHRLMASGGRSDRAAEKWREDYIIPGVEELELQHLYRAMAWLGEELALRYKDLWMVEAIFRAAKTVMETRPIYHKCDATIRGHVFCSFLALVLIKELEDRLAAKGLELEWADVLRDLEALRVTRLVSGAATCELRSTPQGTAGKVLGAAGVVLGPSLMFIGEHE